MAAVFCGVVGGNSDNVQAVSSGSARLRASIGDISINITIPNDLIVLNLSPTASLETDDMSVYVTTDAPYGYTLLMSANDSNLTRTAAIDGAYPTIPTLANESTQVGFAANHWGYKLPSDAKYKPFNNTGTQIGYSDTAVDDKEEVVTFAAKVNSIPPTGDYDINLSIAAVANSKPLGIDDVVYMQDFAEASESDISSILASMTEGTSYTIKDSRDEQEYTVAKLFDGNIWMTKNLNLVGGTTLTPADSNVSAGCNLGNNCTLPGSSTSGFSNDSTAYVYNSNSTTCGNNKPCYSYYSYVAATAGTGASMSSGDATSDICPAGWRLPTKSEYETLIGTYDTGAKLTASPFLGVYAGYYYNSSFSEGGSYGFYWSSTANSNSASTMYFNSSNALIDYNAKRYGFGVRCVQS